MSGHSKWSTIKRKKAAVDQKKGRIFSKLAKEISIAAQVAGGDPAGNPRLRTVLIACRAANMPKDKVEAAIKKGMGDTGDTQYAEIRYEGYGPGGVAIIVDVLTDNKNRTVAEIRHIFGRYHGNMAETGAVTWNFEQKGRIVLPLSAGSEEDIFDKVIEAGAEDLTVTDVYEIATEPTDLHAVAQALEEAGLTPEEAELTMRPKTTLEVDAKTAGQVMRLLEALEENEDVQNVYSNFDMSDEAMAAAMAE
jgi:YebC/PmpR family DNA-binding regulatory protein